MKLKLLLAACGAFALAACDLDRDNPNAPTQEVALSSADGMIGLAVGLQNRFTSSSAQLAYSAGVVTDELGAVAAAVVTISDAELGQVPAGANLTGDLWGSSYRTIKTANDILVNARGIEMDPGTRSGILALAYVLKAGAIGELLMAYERVALDTYGTGGATTFADRATALASVRTLLDSAEQTLNETPPSTVFSTTILARGFDLRNTLFAYRARYERMAGRYTEALAAANAVSRTVFSQFPHDATVPNRLFSFSSGSSGVLPRDVFLAAAAAAGETVRGTYHVTATANLNGRVEPLDNYARYNVNSASFPSYYPDEVLLIKAEALLLLNRETEARAALDSVRRDCSTAATPFGAVTGDPNACRPPLTGTETPAQLLDEIYANRRFELFATGLRWEDLRRRGLVGSAASAPTKRCWLPYPITERNANPNASRTALPDPESEAPPPNGSACSNLIVTLPPLP